MGVIAISQCCSETCNMRDRVLYTLSMIVAIITVSMNFLQEIAWGLSTQHYTFRPCK